MTYEDRDLKWILRLHERVAAVYADDRFPNTDAGGQTRALAVAMIWARWECRDVDDPKAYARTVTRHMGLSWEQIVRRVIRDDAPRYEPPDDRYATVCPAPMEGGPRRGQACGKRPTRSHRVTDPATGRWTIEGYCTKHDLHARASFIAEQVRMKAGGIPEPLPNAGGILPCHVRLKTWPDYYADARYGWEPPAVGIRADDWPVMAKVVAAEAPKLVLIAGRGGDPCGHDTLIAAGRIDHPTPRLALVGAPDDTDT